MALFQALGRLLLEAEDAAPGTVLDREFIDAHCAGFDEYDAHVRAVDLDDRASRPPASTRDQIERVAAAADRLDSAPSICWAMGLTQHTHAVATIARGRQPAAAARQ